MNPIETLLVVLLVCLVKLAFHAAGCWMMYCGWFGCGITTIVLGVLFVGASWDEKNGNSGEDDAGKEKK